MAVASAAPMHILLCCNANYFQHLAVLVSSIAEQTTTRPIHFVVANEDDNPAAEQKVTGPLARYPHVTLRFHRFKFDPAVSLPTRIHYTRDTYTRVWVGDFFDDTVERVLYLDCDAVTAGSLEPLWTTPLNGNTIGAVSIPGSTRPALLGIPEALGYFNSGVLLIDLARWRQTGAFRRLLDYIASKPEALIDADQDALNAVLCAERLRLDYVWNVTSPFYFDWHDLKLAPGELERVRREARIIHFTGVSKPWSYFSRHPRRVDYYRYLKLTAWRDFRPADRTLLNRLRRLAGSVLPERLKRRLRG